MFMMSSIFRVLFFSPMALFLMLLFFLRFLSPVALNALEAVIRSEGHAAFSLTVHNYLKCGVGPIDPQHLNGGRASE